ncbi:WG repeat-containing protein [Aestuariivivens sediminicola]|uniref:WG repeat-containing protein n=1 Tax=Aestuariivivens sediminicola TaxID=2913560 RepID=UPI001F5A10CA|nr:WG repeat-containing protein [Aestuariivivens sediminicola]
MKNLFIIILLCPLFAVSQIAEELDFIAPFNDGVAAVKKDNSWGFINHEGQLVIDFRDDLVTSYVDGSRYPVFSDNRCLFTTKRDGITYFGYIDKTGKTVIEPIFLNALNFNNNKALALHILKEELGDNDVLGKHVVNYKYFEVVLDVNGNITYYLNPKGVNVILDKAYLNSPPEVTSKHISENLFAVQSEHKKWHLVTTTMENGLK